MIGGPACSLCLTSSAIINRFNPQFGSMRKPLGMPGVFQPVHQDKWGGTLPERFWSRALSAKSCGRPTARLLVIKASRPTKSTTSPSISTSRRHGHASSKLTPLIDVRRSNPCGGHQNCTTESSLEKSSSVMPRPDHVPPNPNSLKTQRTRRALFLLRQTQVSSHRYSGATRGQRPRTRRPRDIERHES